MKNTILILFILLTSTAQAQTSQQRVAKVYDSPEEKAYFPFGQDSLDRFVRQNIQFRYTGYKTGGKAVVVFIIEKDGKVGNAEIIRTSGDNDFDKEAVSIVKSMPSWKPAKDKGAVVRSTSMLSVGYKVR